MKYIWLFVASIFCVSMVTVVEAQHIASESGPFAAPISAREVARYTEMLDFDAEQIASARTLYQGYRASVKASAKKSDTKMGELNEKMNNEGDWQRYEEQRTRLMTEFIAESDKANAAFFDDLKALCTNTQAEKFASVERARRRSVCMSLPFAAGEGADLIEILNSLKVVEPADAGRRAEFKEALDQYEMDLDRAAREKDQLFRGVLRMVTEQPDDDERMKIMMKFISDFYSTSTRIRDINRRATRLIEPHVPAEKKSEFDREILRRSYPRLYNESKVEKRLAEASKLADLNEDQRTRLKAMSESYRREADAANASWAREVDAKQEKLSRDFMSAMTGDAEGEDGFLKAKKARKELDDSYLKRIEQMLNPDQLMRMPKHEPDEVHHEPEFMPEFDREKVWKQWEDENE